MHEIKARLSDEAFTGWTAFCEHHGVTLTGLLEAVGRRMLSPEWQSNEQVEAIVMSARQIDTARRSRRDG